MKYTLHCSTCEVIVKMNLKKTFTTCQAIRSENYVAACQEHALTCKVLKSHISDEHKKQILSLEYNDLVGNAF